MTVSQVEQATRRVRKAQADLDRRLETGQDAAAARAALASAQSELEAAEAAAVEREAADEQRVEAEAAALAATVSTEVSAALASIVERIGPLPVPKIEPRWALSVTQARREIDAKRTAADATRERLAGQQQRLASLQADRQAIIARRLEGDERDSDAATMGLIDADLEGLRGLASRTEAELHRQDAELADATERHTQAERRWEVAVQDAWIGALGELALLGEGVIVECAGGMRTHGGDKKRWEPGSHVANLLHGKHF